jgi:type II secretory pathway component PulL
MQEQSSTGTQKRIYYLILAAIIVILGIGIYSTNHKSSPLNVAEKQDEHLLNSWLPQQTDHYKISYSFNQTKKEYDYQVTLFAIINRPSEYDSYIAQLKQYKEEALSYIRSKGADPSKLNIEYLPPAAKNL